jgi:hypothetical protein
LSLIFQEQNLGCYNYTIFVVIILTYWKTINSFVSQSATGTQIVEEGKRRLVEPHWFRGNSYLRIGWKWVKQAIYKSWNLLFSLRFYGGPEPEPSKASHKQYKKYQSRFKGFKCNILNFDTKT